MSKRVEEAKRKLAKAKGWYRAPNSRTAHLFDEDMVSFCRRVTVVLFTYKVYPDAIQSHSSGDCQGCRKRLARINELAGVEL